MSKLPKPIAPESLLKDADFNKVSQYDRSFRQIKSLNDPRFGDIQILQNPSTRQVIGVRERKVTDKSEAARLIVAARNRLELKNPYLVNLLDYSVVKQSELCSSFYIIKYYFEYPRTDLRKLIVDREKNGQGLTSAELTNVLYQQNQAQAYLQSQGLAHGDLQPLYIGYDPERSESKLIDKSDTLINDQAIIQAQKNRMVSGQPLYVSPTMYSNLKKGSTKFQFDRNKEDAFALGLVLLEAGNGRSIQNIYDSKTGQINQGALDQHLEEFNRRFSGQNTLLTSHVSQMVNLNEAARPSPAQIKASLPPYEEVKARLAVDGSTNTSSGFIQGAYPIGVNTSTKSVVEGGDTITKVITKQEMPVVQEDLFNFDSLSLPASVKASQVQWDPSYLQPSKVEVPSARYNFIPNERASQRALVESNTQGAYNYQSEHPTGSDNVFNTFALSKPAKAQTELVYPGNNAGQQFQAESLFDQPLVYNSPNEFGSAFKNNKVYGEQAVGADPNAGFVSTAPAIPEPNAVALKQNITEANAAPLPTGTGVNQNFSSQASAPLPTGTGVNQPLISQAPVQVSYVQSSNVNLVPASMRRSVSNLGKSNIHHEFRLYDSTITEPDVIQGQTVVSPVYTTTTTQTNVITSQGSYPVSSYTNTSVRPSSAYNTSYTTQPVRTYSNVTTVESPVRSSYVIQTPSTYSQTSVPVIRKSSVVYSQPQTVELPVQSYVSQPSYHYVSSTPSATYQIVDSLPAETTTYVVSGDGRQSVAGYQTDISSNSGLKLIGTYFDDRNATIKSTY